MMPEPFYAALSALTGQPFKAFVVALYDGQRYEVTHPDGIDVENDLLTVHEPDGTIVHFDPSSVVSMFVVFGDFENGEDIPE